MMRCLLVWWIGGLRRLVVLVYARDGSGSLVTGSPGQQFWNSWQRQRYSYQTCRVGLPGQRSPGGVGSQVNSLDLVPFLL